MTRWAQRFHLLLTIGGGFTGLAIGLGMLVNNWHQLNAIAVLLALAYCALCAWSVSVGLRLAEGRSVGAELRAFYLVQIPYFTTPGVTFHAGFGFMFYVGTLSNGRNIQWQLGADWQSAVLTDEGWYFAINIVPLIVLWFLGRPNKSEG